MSPSADTTRPSNKRAELTNVAPARTEAPFGAHPQCPLGHSTRSGDSMTTTSHTSVHCKRCRVSFPLPALPDPDRDRVASSVREGQHIQAIQLLRQLAGFDLRDGKAVEMHITRARGVCVRCGGQLPTSGQTECPRCGSLNLDW